MNTPFSLVLNQIEYSCSPGGIDTWELLSLSGNYLGGWVDIRDAIYFINKKYGEYKIDLQINSLKNYHKQED
jgi:hypothetical protein